MLALAALIIVAVSGVGIVGGFGSSKDAAPTSNSFTFAGSLRGTLKLDPNLNCGRSAGGATELAEIAGTLFGSNSKQWTIVIAGPGNGTFKVPPATTGNAGASVTIRAAGAMGQSWSASTGSVTVDDSTGSLHVTARPSSGTGTVTVTGRWECPA